MNVGRVVLGNATERRKDLAQDTARPILLKRVLRRLMNVGRVVLGNATERRKDLAQDTARPILLKRVLRRLMNVGRVCWRTRKAQGPRARHRAPYITQEPATQANE